MSLETTPILRPVELYTFARGTRVWRYADRGDVTLSGLVYRAAVIERGGIRRGDETNAASMTVHVAAATPVVADWLGAAAAGEPDARLPTTLTVVRAFRDAAGAVDADPATRQAVFVGEIAGLPELEDGDQVTATLTAQDLRAGFGQPLLRYRFQRTCNHVLGDYRCGVDLRPLAVAATVAAVGAGDRGPTATVTLDAAFALPVRAAAVAPETDPTTGDPIDGTGSAEVLDTTYFDGGEFVVGGDRIGVVAADLSALPTAVLTLYLAAPLPASAVGLVGAVTPGCDLTRATCGLRFDNVVRFGGFDALPERNPQLTGVL